MTKLPMFVCGLMVAACAFLAPSLCGVAQADEKLTSSADEANSSASAASPVLNAAPPTWQPSAADTLLKQLQRDTPRLSAVTPETKRALVQTLTMRLTVARLSLKNAEQSFVLAHNRLVFYQAQAKAAPTAPATPDLTSVRLDVANARAFVLASQKDVNETSTLFARAQSLSVLAPVLPPAAPSLLSPPTRTLQYTSADAAALIKRPPLFTPTDQAGSGLRPLKDASQSIPAKP